MAPFLLSILILAFTLFNLVTAWLAYRPLRRLRVLWAVSIVQALLGLALALALYRGVIPLLALGKGIFLVGAFGGETQIYFVGSSMVNSSTGLGVLVGLYAVLPLTALAVGEFLFRRRTDDKYYYEGIELTHK